MLIGIINRDDKVVAPSGRATVCVENQYSIFIARLNAEDTSPNTLTAFKRKATNIINTLIIICKYFIEIIV